MEYYRVLKINELEPNIFMKESHKHVVEVYINIKTYNLDY
jgi:hypothetical protein